MNERDTRKQQIKTLVNQFYDQFEILHRDKISELYNKALLRYLETDMTIEEIVTDMEKIVYERLKMQNENKEKMLRLRQEQISKMIDEMAMQVPNVSQETIDRLKISYFKDERDLSEIRKALITQVNDYNSARQHEDFDKLRINNIILNAPRGSAKQDYIIYYLDNNNNPVIQPAKIDCGDRAKHGIHDTMKVVVNDGEFNGFLKPLETSKQNYYEIVMSSIGNMLSIPIAQSYRVILDGKEISIISRDVSRNSQEELIVFDDWDKMILQNLNDNGVDINSLLAMRKQQFNSPTDMDGYRSIIEYNLAIMHAGLDSEEYMKARKQFLESIVFDYLVNQTDRNSSNYGVIVDKNSRKGIRLAPLFDNSAVAKPGLNEDETSFCNVSKVNRHQLLECVYQYYYDDIKDISSRLSVNRDTYMAHILQISKNYLDYYDSKSFVAKVEKNYQRILLLEQKKEIQNQEVQNQSKARLYYNYHTHTNRCGHAGVSSDKEYVEYAKANGITRLGFSDHVPVTELEYQDEDQRMHISDVDEYIDSIRKLQRENPDMEIICGFEAEFDPMKEQFLGELREKVDYMILGQHYVQNGMQKVQQINNPNYPIEYANMVCNAMESGIFDIVAHPDIFMQFRDSMDSESARTLFDQNAMIAARQICEKAKEIGIPLEINFGDINKNKIMKDGKVSYPYSKFWKIAAETDVSVLYGVDAHTPKQFSSMAQDKQKADSIIGINGLNFVDRDYNPVEARKKNQKLNELYAVGQSKALTYETHLISQITEGIIDRIPDESFNPNDFAFVSEQAISNVSQDCTMRASAKEQKTMSKIKKISSSTELPTQEKTFQLNRAKSAIEHTNDTLSNQQSALERAKESTNTAVEIGCQNKTEIKSTVTQLTEGKTTKSEEKKSAIATNIQTIQSKNNTNANKEQTKGPVLVKTNNQKKNTGNNGFINTISLALIITFVCGVAVGIGYMLYKISIG